MAMLADLVEVVIGVDTHKHTHTAAVVQAVSGAGLGHRFGDPAGYRQRGGGHHQDQRCGHRRHRRFWCWPDPFLAPHEQVVELDRPSGRPPRCQVRPAGRDPRPVGSRRAALTAASR